MKKTLLAGIFGLICSSSALAAVEDRVILNVDPLNWRLQTYTSTTVDAVITFFTGSACPNGTLTLPAIGSVERTRYWDTVMAAKLSRKRISLFYSYDNVANTCAITSYWLNEPTG
jgi:hypothetical protein